jgi:multiple sugar transport system permease protein
MPFVWMLSTALKEISQIMKSPPDWIPNPVKWENFIAVTKTIPFWLYTKNTLLICILNVVGTIFSCSMAAYAFSRVEWKGRNKFFAITLATMMIPFPILIVPLYTIFRSLGWIGTLNPLWVPSFFGSAYNIFLIRQFFMTIPMDLSEAAEIDGCSHFRIYLQIILPLAKPALLVVALFTFMYNWNDFLGPLIYITDSHNFTLALGLQAFQSRDGGTAINLLMAASTLMILPIIIMFFFMQKTFIEGISMTGIKA